MTSRLSRTVATATIGLAVLALTACGHNDTPAPQAKPSTTATAPATTPSTTPTATATAAPASVKAVGPFSAKDVTAVVATAEKFTQVALVNQNLLTAREHTARDYATVLPYLTPDYQAEIKKAITGAGADAGPTLDRLVVRVPASSPFKPNTETPASEVRIKAESKPYLDNSDGTDPALVVTVHTKITYVGTQDGKAATLTQSRDIRYRIVPNGDPEYPFVISGLSVSSTNS